MSMYPSNYYRPQFGQYGRPNPFGRMQQEFNAMPNIFGRRQQEFNSPLNQFSRPQQQNFYGPTDQFNRWQQDVGNWGNPSSNQEPSFNSNQQQQPFLDPYNRQQQPAFNSNNRQPPLINQYQQQQPIRRIPPIQDTLNTIMSHAGTINNGVNVIRQMGSLLASLR